MVEQLRRFAEGTKVSVEASRGELEKLLKKHGATQTMVHTAADAWTVMYEMRGRMLKQIVRVPEQEPFRLASSKRPRGKKPSNAEVAVLVEREWRRRWRAAVLILKARLEAVAAGDAEFEAMFLGDIMLPSGETAAEVLKPKLVLAYESGEMPPLLLGTGRKE